MTDRWYPDVEDVLVAHEQILARYPETSTGVRDRGALEYAVSSVREGPPTGQSTSIHRDAYQLMRLLVANHPFVDANKRTALATVSTFYLLNGLRFEYTDEIRDILKRFGTDESAVNESNVVTYLRTHTEPIDFEAIANEWHDELVRFGLDRLGADDTGN